MSLSHHRVSSLRPRKWPRRAQQVDTRSPEPRWRLLSIGGRPVLCCGGSLSANPLKGFTRLYRSHRAQIIWLPEHILAFMKVAPIELQQALILALHTGLRQGDLLRLRWSAYDGNKLSVRPGKSRRGDKPGDEIEIPCTKALRRTLNQMERRSPLILTTATGRAFKKRYFSQLWSRAMREAEIETVTLSKKTKPVRLHFHDLRGTTVTLLSEAGNNPQQIATITGHSLRTVHQIMEGYLARTRGLAEQAISNFENSPRTRFANRLKTSAARGTNANRDLKKKR
jgi:integrase